MAVKIRLVRNNIAGSPVNGKYLAKTVSQGEVGLFELAQELRREGLSRGTVEGVIIDLERAIQRNLRDGKTVVLPRLGRFSLRVESDCVEEPTEFDIARHIRRVVCRFLSTGTRGHQRNGNITQTLAEGAAVEWQKGCKPSKSAAAKLKKEGGETEKEY